MKCLRKKFKMTKKLSMLPLENLYGVDSRGCEFESQRRALLTAFCQIDFLKSNVLIERTKIEINNWPGMESTIVLEKH